MLDATAHAIRSYVAMTGVQATGLALWVAHTHALQAARFTPYLAITSAEKQSGKSQLLDVLELLAARAWKAVTPSDPVVFRKIAADTPTLLLDEVDAIFGPKARDNEGLRALLNAGHRRGQTVPRCEGSNHAIREFDTFCPKALAGIGDLPDTVADRSIPVRLRRRSREERIERFRYEEASAALSPLRESWEEWVASHHDALAQARPDTPDALSDRAADGWEPLLAIADAGGRRMA